MKFKVTAAGFLCERRKHGLTQTEIAAKLKITPQYVCNWEKGKSGIPAELVNKLSKIIKVPVEYIASWAVLDFEANYIKKLSNNK